MARKDRNDRLDDLTKSVKAWSEKRTKQLEDQVIFAKRVLTGRTGANRLQNESVSSATGLVVDEIAQFLEV